MGEKRHKCVVCGCEDIREIKMWDGVLLFQCENCKTSVFVPRELLEKEKRTSLKCDKCGGSNFSLELVGENKARLLCECCEEKNLEKEAEKLAKEIKMKNKAEKYNLRLCEIKLKKEPNQLVLFHKFYTRYDGTNPILTELGFKEQLVSRECAVVEYENGEIYDSVLAEDIKFLD